MNQPMIMKTFLSQIFKRKMMKHRNLKRNMLRLSKVSMMKKNGPNAY